MSEDAEYKYDEKGSVNKITPLDMATWKFLIQAHIRAKGWNDALEKPRPAGAATSVAWDRKSEKAYDYILKCCQENEAAMNIAMEIDNKDFTAKELLTALEERFDRKSLSSLVQKKERIFFNMRIAANQTAENFIEQLIKARRELVGLGCEYITLEDHCKNLLQEAMLHDERFRDQANAFSAASDVT